MKIGSLSIGGGGAAINNSLRSLLDQDYRESYKQDPVYAELLYRNISYCYADSNKDTLRFTRNEAERILLGTGGLGCANDPQKGYEAFMASRDKVAEFMQKNDVILLSVATGKGTGAGSLVPAVELARELKKLVIPFVAFPALNVHEVTKAKYDQAKKSCAKLDDLKVRYVQIMNDTAYTLRVDKETAMTMLNSSIAKALRSFMYVLQERSQFDLSDIAKFFAGPGRIRPGTADLGDVEQEKNEGRIEKQAKEKAADCFVNRFYGFDQKIGDTLICIEGAVPMTTVGKLRNEIGRLASGETADDSSFEPHHVDANKVPKPWGVTAIFTEYTGVHEPMEIVWLPETDEILPSKYTFAGYEESPAKIEEPAAATQAHHSPTKTTVAHMVAAAPNFPWSFKEFERQLRMDKPEAKKIALGDLDPTKVMPPVNGDDFKQLFSALGFRQMLKNGVFSDSWKELIRATADKETLTNRPYKGKGSQLQQQTIEKLLTLPELELGSLDPEVRRDVLFIRHIAACFGNEFAQDLLKGKAREVPPSNGNMPQEVMVSAG